MRLLRLYATVVHWLRNSLASTGALQRLEEATRSSRFMLWLRSLLSVLDFDDFQRLDVPWWTFTATERVRKFLDAKPHARVFEWGSGASTVWLSKRVGEVYSVESDPQWASQVRAAVGANVEMLTVVPPTRAPGMTGLSRRIGYRGLDYSGYVDAIDRVPGVFDLVVIDGRARPYCLPKALERLAPGGMIVFDNTNRLRYRTALKQWSHRARVATDWGLTPILPWPSMTSTVTVRQVPQAASTSGVTTR